MDCNPPGSSVFHYLPGLLKFMSIEWVMLSNHLVLCHPLLLLPSIFPSIRVFSKELAPLIKWAKYWSFRFCTSPSNKYPGLISFRIDLLDLFPVQETLKSLLQHISVLWQPREVGWGGRWKGDSRGRGKMYIYGWFMSMYSRNQQNIVKKLSSN